MSLLRELIEGNLRFTLALFERLTVGLDHEHFLSHHRIVELEWFFVEHLVADWLVLHIIRILSHSVENCTTIISHLESLPVLQLFQRNQSLLGGGLVIRLETAVVPILEKIVENGSIDSGANDLEFFGSNSLLVFHESEVFIEAGVVVLVLLNRLGLVFLNFLHLCWVGTLDGHNGLKLGDCHGLILWHFDLLEDRSL